MKYQIDETGFSNLENVRTQLGFIACLVGSASDEKTLSSVTVGQFSAFIGAQEAALEKVVEAAVFLRENPEQPLPAQQPHSVISANLMMGLLDAACGELTDAEALNKLWDEIYAAGVIYRPYMDVLGHFLDVMRARGLVLCVQSLDGQPSRDWVPTSKPKSVSPAKPRKRSRLESAESV